MPFVSNAQRKYLFANEPAVAREFAAATPKGKKLPEHVKKSNLRGVADALERFGFKQAAEELRLKIPSRTFHGYDAAHKAEAERGAKRADCEQPHEETADGLAELLKSIEAPTGAGQQLAARDPLDRATAWGTASNLAAGDTANRLSDMGQNTGFGGV